VRLHAEKELRARRAAEKKSAVERERERRVAGVGEREVAAGAGGVAALRERLRAVRIAVAAVVVVLTSVDRERSVRDSRRDADREARGVVFGRDPRPRPEEEVQRVRVVAPLLVGLALRERDRILAMLEPQHPDAFERPPAERVAAAKRAAELE